MIQEKQVRYVLSRKRKTKEILELLKGEGIDISDRQWRKYVRRYNNDYANRDRYIASDNQGYFLTSKKKAITKTNINKMKCALSMLNNAKNDLKELSEKGQLSLLDEDVEFYDMAMKLNEYGN